MSDDAKRELSDEQIDAACLAAWKAAGFIGRPVASNEWYRVTYLAGYRAAPAADAVKREGLSDELAAISNALAHSPFRRHQSMALTVARAAAALAAPASAQTPAGERERFERWAAALDEPRYENGDYKNDHVQTQWEAWQAALFAGDRS